MRCKLKGYPEKLNQTAYFSWVTFFSWSTVPLSGTHINSMILRRHSVRRAARIVKSSDGRHSSVSEMCYELGGSPLCQRRHGESLIIFFKIINVLAEVPFEDILIEAYKGTRPKQNKKLTQIGHSNGSHFPPKQLVHGTSLLSPRLHHWQNININF